MGDLGKSEGERNQIWSDVNAREGRPTAGAEEDSEDAAVSGKKSGKGKANKDKKH